MRGFHWQQTRARLFLVSLIASVVAVSATPGKAVATDFFVDTYSGADLFALKDHDEYFPSGRATQLIENTSLFYFQSTTPGEKWEKLLQLPVVPAGTNPVRISVVLSLTNLPPTESDPHIMLGDGERLVGVEILDVNPTNGGTALAMCEDLDVVYGGMDYSSSFIPSPSPVEGEPYTVSVVWTLGDLTRVDASLFDMSGSSSAPATLSLDPSKPLSFVFMSDNQPLEKYQINWLTISVVHRVSCNCSNPGLFDPPMDQNVTVKKGNRVLPLKFTLCDINGDPVTDLDIAPPMAQVEYLGPQPAFFLPVDDLLTVGQGDDGNLFVYTGSHWQLNLQTKRFEAQGVYEISVVSTDPEFDIVPTCSVFFTIE